MKTFEKFADLLEMAIYVILGLTTAGLILWCVIEMFTNNNLTLISY